MMGFVPTRVVSTSSGGGGCFGLPPACKYFIQYRVKNVVSCTPIVKKPHPNAHLCHHDLLAANRHDLSAANRHDLVLSPCPSPCCSTACPGLLALLALVRPLQAAGLLCLSGFSRSDLQKSTQYRANITVSSKQYSIVLSPALHTSPCALFGRLFPQSAPLATKFFVRAWLAKPRNRVELWALGKPDLLGSCNNTVSRSNMSIVVSKQWKRYRAYISGIEHRREENSKSHKISVSSHTASIEDSVVSSENCGIVFSPVSFGNPCFVISSGSPSATSLCICSGIIRVWNCSPLVFVVSSSGSYLHWVSM